MHEHEEHPALERVLSARVRNMPPELRCCSAPHVSGHGSWCTGGMMPTMHDRDADEAHAFRAITLGVDRRHAHVGHVRVVIPRDQGGYHAARAFMVERGYLVAFYRRGHETLSQTAARRQRVFMRRLDEGLPVSIPNAVGLGAKVAA